ncbi:hypothetical protein JXJ21_13500 [candidate division KSB1 bacterium]|nr:hypothetical protein [candidate division KSB1 bacterium]
MTKKKTSPRKKKHIPSAQTRTIPNQIRKARDFPIDTCYCNSEWKDMGKSTVIITRIKPDGFYIVADFLIDLWCLGVKNVFSHPNISEQKLREIVDGNEAENMVPTSSDHAHSLVYGALDYAQRLGFAPHKDYDVAQYVLEPFENIEYDDTIEFGKDGKPLYFTGPYDTPEKERRIIETLRKSVGEGNFNYVIKPQLNL